MTELPQGPLPKRTMCPRSRESPSQESVGVATAPGAGRLSSELQPEHRVLGWRAEGMGREPGTTRILGTGSTREASPQGGVTQRLF